ncbi:MAG: hypothetical protein GTO54_06350 [Nitrososphaeria archaeon]|nr:hypothetical protein [Nitrososphaeria archaeon]
MPKFKPRCPTCNSVLRKAKKGYLCPDSKCKVITVHFDRSLKIRKIVYEGFDSVPVFRGKQRE